MCGIGTVTLLFLSAERRRTNIDHRRPMYSFSTPIPTLQPNVTHDDDRVLYPSLSLALQLCALIFRDHHPKCRLYTASPSDVLPPSSPSPLNSPSSSICTVSSLILRNSGRLSHCPRIFNPLIVFELPSSPSRISHHRWCSTPSRPASIPCRVSHLAPFSFSFRPYSLAPVPIFLAS